MRFLIFVFAFLFIAAIFFVRDEILSKKAKIIATALIVLLCAGAYFYESASERSARLNLEFVVGFMGGVLIFPKARPSAPPSLRRRWCLNLTQAPD